VATTAGGATAEVTLTPNVTVGPGVYWLVQLHTGSAAPTVWGTSTLDYFVANLLGGTTGAAVVNTGTAKSTNYTGGTGQSALPSSFGAATISAAAGPLAFVKVA
jgi:hypothetical protein